MRHHLLRTSAAVAAGVLAGVGLGAAPATAAVAPLGVVTEVTAGISADTEPYEIVAAPDGNLWFTEPRANRIARVTPRGAVSELTAGIGSGTAPLHLTVGPDGNLWYSSAYKNQVSRITPAGSVTDFPAGDASGRISSLVQGPDGNLWYVKSRAVGRMTPSGAVTEFSAGLAADSRLGDIAAGPDGNLWFSEYQGGRVGRITPAGAVTEFPAAPDPESSLSGIVGGPDGTMWFTVDGQVPRITADGVVSALPYTGVGTMAVLPDGSVWFSRTTGTGVGRISQTGAVRTFGTGITDAATDLTGGPDGNVWFTELSGDRVGRIGTGTPVTVTCVEKGGVTQARLKVVCRTTGLGPSSTLRWKVTRKDNGALVARGRKSLVGGKLVMNLSHAHARKGRHRVTLTRGSGIDTVVVTRVLRLT
jgi:streptogramin lyase